jgi:molybdopterin synthase catalytic subunit
MIRVSQDPIHSSELVEWASSTDHGAVATFFGTVRARNAGKTVTAVEYHAYPTMAERKLEQIADEMQRGFGALRIAIVHRIGHLAVGETSVAIAVGSEHRREALGAVAYAIERIKREVPIWKKEIYADGTAWLEPEPGDHAPPQGGEGTKKGEGGGLPLAVPDVRD